MLSIHVDQRQAADASDWRNWHENEAIEEGIAIRQTETSVRAESWSTSGQRLDEMVRRMHVSDSLSTRIRDVDTPILLMGHVRVGADVLCFIRVRVCVRFELEPGWVRSSDSAESRTADELFVFLF